MKNGLSFRLAVGNIRKNYRFFIPRILAETGLAACFYIIFTLACDDRLASVKGGSYLPTFMWMGAVIIGLLSAVLMLYTNSFLMKQRKREFGLYNVLGMEKKHICRVLFWESFVCSLLSVLLGVLGGMLFYKLCSLAICRLLKTEIIAGFYYVTPMTVIPSCLVFLAIDTLAFAVNCIGIARMKPVELLAGAGVGEKEPRVKWVLLILGGICLCGGYAISLTVENPLQAILLFFAAVLLVIAGTYFLFIAGSVFVLKALRKKETYYYYPRHITAVSGLLYRMKQNAVGLASVAILATGVLVMISTTFCLYSRTEAVLEQNYPQDYYVPTAVFTEDGTTVHIPEEVIGDMVRREAEKHGLRVRAGMSQTFFEVTYLHRSGELIADAGTVTDETDFAGLCNFTVITEQTYVKLGGTPLGLQKNEVAVCPCTASAPFGDSSFVLDGITYRVRDNIIFFPINTVLVAVNCFGVVVPDEETFLRLYEGQQKAYGDVASEIQYRYCVSFADKGRAMEVGKAFSSDVERDIDGYLVSLGYDSYSIGGFDAFWEARESLYGMYGTLLFLGILLGTVSLFATVLIIYYKQISEGYEDRSRYQIMLKIGMTEKEVKQTVRSQMMLVFFLPLLTAGIHTAFAYPILTKLMEVLLLDNPWRFAGWSLIVYAVFALVYTLIYRLTAKTYCKIVND